MTILYHIVKQFSLKCILAIIRKRREENILIHDLAIRLVTEQYPEIGL